MTNPRRVNIKAIRDKRHNKYYNIWFSKEESKILGISKLKLDLNKSTRPNLKDGSREMYNVVNGLCQYCGHDSFTATCHLHDTRNYVISDMKCKSCKKIQPFAHVVSSDLDTSKNRGKEYYERKKKAQKLSVNKNSKYKNKNRRNSDKKKPY